MGNNLLIGVGGFLPVGDERFSSSKVRRQVTALNGNTAEVDMTSKSRGVEFLDGGMNVSLQTQKWLLSYGVDFPAGPTEKVAEYRYWYSDPSHSVTALDGSEVAYLRTEQGIQQSVSIGREISRDIGSVFGRPTRTYIKGGLRTRTVTIIQGTEAWGKDGHEITVGREKLWGGSLDITCMSGKSIDNPSLFNTAALTVGVSYLKGPSLREIMVYAGIGVGAGIPIE